ncbi:transposase [Streptomyces sp. NPDC059766]|uniref:transposase n=1 Tax=Streptomyces sp. NPDC059766 TaxID=3346940 RepID=UPI003648281A
MIDRLVHHAEVISLKGDSYRMRGRDLGRVPAANTGHPLRPGRRPAVNRPPMARPPSPREATRWIMSHPDRLHDDDQLQLKALLARSPELAAATTHVRTFATIMTNREGDRLREWIANVCADEQHGLASFAAGLITDLDAVVFGMSAEWSSGPVEGRVNDLKALKRGMFGRARLPLLRKRLLLFAASRRPQTVTNSRRG